MNSALFTGFVAIHRLTQSCRRVFYYPFKNPFTACKAIIGVSNIVLKDSTTINAMVSNFLKTVYIFSIIFIIYSRH